MEIADQQRQGRAALSAARIGAQMPDYKKLSYPEAKRRFLDGSLSPRTYLDQCLEHIAQHDGELKAFVHLDAEAARRQVDAATERYRSGRPASAVDGLPFGVKDMIATATMPTEMNSPLFKGYRPRSDALSVRSLLHHGAAMVGKTATTELAIGSAATTVNPWNANRTPGGSSSGSAACVGAGLLPACLGTQTQGSVIRPASYCGAVGFKPTWGSLSTEGLHPVSPTHDHLGFITDTVQTAWWMAQSVAQTAHSVFPKFGNADDVLENRLPRRLAILRVEQCDELDAPSSQAFEDHLDQLSRSGIQLVEASASMPLADLMRAMAGVVQWSADIVAYEMQAPYASYADHEGHLLGERIHAWLAHSSKVNDDLYQSRRKQRRQLRERFNQLAGEFDAFILPSSSGPAPAGLSQTGSRSLQVYGSYLGVPAFSLPLLHVHGMPMGSQLLGFTNADHALSCHAHGVFSRLAPHR